MFETVYIEEDIASHPRIREIVERLPHATLVSCHRFGEVFNRGAQSFRLQKRRPALVLARKHGELVLPAPSRHGGGRTHEYYFSHAYNCVFDCRYCFLQGMFRSAHLVVFVNFEDFASAIEERARDAARDGVEPMFYSGYDTDSLALEPLTGFADHFLDVFAAIPGAWLELRTKSVQVRGLLDREPLDRVVVAFSITPEAIRKEVEHGVPPLARRLDAIERLQSRGWRIGLHFDPMVWRPDWRELYRDLVEGVFERIDPGALHSVSVGAFRVPRDYFRAMTREDPDERIFAAKLEDRDGMVSYPKELEREMVGFLTEELARRAPAAALTRCVL
ncbi:MAG TPA: DNA photolyase [Planctomycetota bacterium]|nr:DNA photolyase [Planctomycetota bacterium]